MKFSSAMLPLAAGFLAAACGHPEAPAYEDVRPVRSIVAGTSGGSVGATYSGEVPARYESKLGFQTSGRIVSRMVEVGSHVKRGQPLLRHDPAQETLQVDAATADVEAAKARVAQNRIDLQRTEQLLAHKFASQAEVDQQKLSLDQSDPSSSRPSPSSRSAPISAATPTCGPTATAWSPPSTPRPGRWSAPGSRRSPWPPTGNGR